MISHPRPSPDPDKEISTIVCCRQHTMVYVANLTMWRSLPNPSVEWETKAKIAT